MLTFCVYKHFYLSLFTSLIHNTSLYQKLSSVGIYTYICVSLKIHSQTHTFIVRCGKSTGKLRCAIQRYTKPYRYRRSMPLDTKQAFLYSYTYVLYFYSHHQKTKPATHTYTITLILKVYFVPIYYSLIFRFFFFFPMYTHLQSLIRVFFAYVPKRRRFFQAALFQPENY